MGEKAAGGNLADVTRGPALGDRRGRRRGARIYSGRAVDQQKNSKSTKCPIWPAISRVAYARGVRVQLQIAIDLDVDPASSLAELVRQAHEAMQRLSKAERRSVVLKHGESSLSGADHMEKMALGTWLAPEGAPPDEVTLRLEETEICMHSSPYVPGQGFLCGWC